MTCPVSASSTPAVAPAGASWALASLALAMLMASLGTSIANVALPDLVQAFGSSFNAVQWVMLAYLLAVTTLAVSVGRLGDLFGRRRLMLAGVSMFTAASVVCGMSAGLWTLVAARAAQGSGAAIMTALAMALVADAVPRERAGRAMGFLGTTSAVGTALGPSLGGVLVESFGWPSIFLVNVPLGLLAFGLAFRFLPRDPLTTERPAFDHAGSAVLALTLAAYALSMTLESTSIGPLGIGLVCVALGGSGLFVIVETRARSPLVRPALFRNRAVSTGFVMSALVTTVAMTTLLVGPFHLSGALRLSPAAVGLVMTTGPLVAALVGVPAGRGVDRFGAPCMTIAGLLAMLVGCAGLAVVPVSTAVAGYVLPLITTTAGFAIFQAANNTAVVTGIEASQRGVVSGLLTLSRNLGLITGASVMGAVFAAGTRSADVSTAGASAIASGAHAAFMAAAVLVVIALVLAITAATGTSSTANRP